MKTRPRLFRLLCLALILCAAHARPASAASAAVAGWNNLGMHCMDSDYSVFSILPPYNTIEAQLIVAGKLVTNGSGYTISYEAVADPDGSFNATAMGKGNFYTYAMALYGASLAPEMGLAGWAMPGTNNVPQGMLFEETNHPAAGVAVRVNWFRAEGIPIAPYDDAHNKNAYPVMRIIARNASSQAIATNDIVLPVSDEMDCRACHASGSQASAKPSAGWVWDGLPERDFRLNILRLHDERQFTDHQDLYVAALAARGFNAQGLYRGVVADGKPVLCASCHASEALGTASYSTIPPLTASVHSRHATVMDPMLHITLDSSANRDACYRCHPGSATRCLRGAMGGAIASDGSMKMQCQSCHGSMSTVGASTRVGWFMEPLCQSCHSGTATTNSGQIRFTSVFTDTNGTVRVAADSTFGTQPDTPAPGISLYRFSTGHGGLQCSACHGSTHAEFPSTHRNDNLRNIRMQGHAGTLVECTACHVTMAATAARVRAGPHGMHPIGQDWVENHHDLFSGSAQCKSCHGTDYRGTVLSRAHGDRSYSALGNTVRFARGAQIGCYTCHLGPSQSTANNAAAPTVANVTATTSNDQSLVIGIPTSGTNLTLTILVQPANGSVGLAGTNATYFPYAGFVGTDSFTYIAYDGAKNSTPGTGTVIVGQGPYSIGATASVPTNYPATWPVAFAVVPHVTNTTAPVSFDWDFGDASPHGTSQFPDHTYAVSGVYVWIVRCSVGAATSTNAGAISIVGPPVLATGTTGSMVNVVWVGTEADTVLEASSELGPDAVWVPVTNAVNADGQLLSVTVEGVSNQFFRQRRPW